jgi:hypothetical protein
VIDPIVIVDPQVAVLAARAADSAQFYAFWGLVVGAVSPIFLIIATGMMKILLHRMTLLEKNTNSIKDALVATTAVAANLQGRADLIKEQQSSDEPKEK